MAVRIFPANIDHLYEMLDFVREEVCGTGFSGGQGYLELAIEEAIVNIVEHGYAASKGDVEIQCLKIPNGIKIVLIDSGIPYNPLIKSDFAAHAIGMCERKTGYGTDLLLKIVREAKYEYRERKNILSLSF